MRPLVRLVSACFSRLPRVRPLTIGVAIACASGLTLANLWSQPVTGARLTKILYSQPGRQERAYGWPLVWYWRSHAMPPHRISSTDELAKPLTWFWITNAGRWTPQWTVSRHDVSRLAVNLLAWFVFVAALSALCHWFFRRHVPRLKWRPSHAALAVLATLTVLANLSCDAPPLGGSVPLNGEYAYGWPLIWYWRSEWANGAGAFREWDFSAAALAGNLILWLAMFVGLAAAWQRFVPRYRLPRRWSLRTMLFVVAAAAALFSWLAALRNRVNNQDAVAVWLSGYYTTYFQHSGPRWLDVVGAERSARRLVGVKVDLRDKRRNENYNNEMFARLARLGQLRCLELNPGTHRQPPAFTREMAAALGDMRQLRALNLECRVERELMWRPDGTSAWGKGHWEDVELVTRECLSAAGKLTQLERLRLDLWRESSHYLASLRNLKNLKTLCITMAQFSDRDRRKDVGNIREPLALARLPVLSQLDDLIVSGEMVTDADLRQLTGFDRLRTLDVSGTSVTAAGLAQLAALESLEVVGINDDMTTVTGFKSLAKLKHLKTVHIDAHYIQSDVRPETLPLDDEDELAVLPQDAEGLKRALEALRQSHPGIVIDTRYEELVERFGLKPSWFPVSPDFARRWFD